MRFGRRSARKVESYLHSQQAPVVATDQNVVTSDPTGRESRRRRTAAKELKKRRVQSLDLLRSNEAEQQRAKEK
ncbi:hypothetical protein KFK09_015471 [Dendrobium nobile]|uniref:Uncharacterized protein n=1 Tax=Dendrobium nobile TaxID=94219 RepID=A0A8T3B6W5_DENNO|nr:hypothetical protein KFK09_015471 [Dendrobium nobile]